VTELQRSIRAFRIHLLIRLAGYAALMGLVIALVIVIAAPWLRQYTGVPGYWLTLFLPLIVPAIYVAYALLQRPNERTTVLAADQWCGAEGSIISAYELEREHPDSPFTRPVVEKAIDRLRQRRLPEPRLLRKLMIAMLVLFALVPLSRLVHAQMDEAEQEAEGFRTRGSKTEVAEKEAEAMAKEAGLAAELAKQLGASEQEGLANDLEEAARQAQAGEQDKERALREANSLVDRARAQTEAQDRREEARDALKERGATRELGEAIDNADPREAEQAIRKMAEDVFQPNGEIDRAKAEELKRAMEDARNAAPQDLRLRRAAEQIENMLEEDNLKKAQTRREELEKEMKGQGLSEEQLAAAMEKLNELDKETLQRALEEMSKAASPMRDMDAKQMEELLKQLEAGEIDPEEAKRLAETAKQLSERLELDAETLREMLKSGREFEGLDKAAEEIVKKMGEGQAGGPQEIPEWAKDAVPEEWVKEWQEAERAGHDNDESGRENGNGGSNGNGERRDGEGTEGGGKGGKPEGGGSTKPVDEGGKEEGVDTGDTGEGEKDPNAKEEKLDPNKARDEKANREKTGRDSDSKGINTRDEEERLPRRYRDAARKYFER
jgi:hypothetical protein